MDDYEVKNAEVEARLKELGNYLKGRMPEGMGFTLLMSDFKEKGATFYISSIEREGAINSMLEFVAKQGGRPDSWLIWSNEHMGWWKPGKNGYTQLREKAGRYSYGDAAQICRDANAHPKHEEEPNECMVQDY